MNIAARVAALAEGGRALATGPVAVAARAEGIAADPLGPVALKNLRERIEIFSLGIGVESQAGVDPVCRMRVQPEIAAGHLRFGERDYWFCSLRCAAEFPAHPEAHADRE